ncbi:LLM class flavin-dependent oxidoreductase [Spirillospora sp. NPDC047279]|uniref:LLM class flavin-dependent oxidoreductase n=1 Tax=Spirillospora sp. NPDC047279 TaxID=3155478 RepID=UPI00340DB736
MSELRIGTVMWPMEPWPAAGELWRRAEGLGFHAAWVYDHTAWRGTTPWYDAYTTLAAAAAVTGRVRLGTLVTSPNFRHPVPTAHAAKTIDHISGGRLTLAIGAGGGSRTSDAGILGGPEWTPGERAGRFAEWVDLLDALLRGPETTFEGEYYSAREVVTSPGCVQRPRIPFAIAATGPRGLRLAARQGDMWVTTGDRAHRHDPQGAVRRQIAGLEEACAAEGRDPGELRRLFLTGFTHEPWLASPDAFTDLAGRYAALGVTDIALHWPRPGTAWDADMKVFEAVAAEHGAPA